MAKVTFDGSTKLITLVSGVTSIDVQTDIYSEWKSWATGNAQYSQAMRSTGGDPLPGGKAIGRYFFLLNGWQLKAASPTTDDVELIGNLFTEDGSNLFVTSSGIQLMRQVVSQLSDISYVSGSGGSGGLTAGQASQLSNIEIKVTTNSSSLAYQTASLIQQSSSIASLDDKVDQLLLAGGSLTPSQSTMLIEMYRLLGLDPTKPLVVTPSTRRAGSEISQSISLVGSDVTVTRL